MLCLQRYVPTLDRHRALSNVSGRRKPTVPLFVFLVLCPELPFATIVPGLAYPILVTDTELEQVQPHAPMV